MKGQNPNESILLCAPIKFDKNEVQMASLPASEDEVKEIKYLFLSNGGAELKTEGQASEMLLKSDELAKYKYLHFATHGQVNESKPELSRMKILQIFYQWIRKKRFL